MNNYINITFCPTKISADEVRVGKKIFVNQGKKHHRIQFVGVHKNNILAIRTHSTEVLKKKPRLSPLNVLTHKWVVLRVKNGETEGFIKVSAGSLRERLGISKEDFYARAKKDKWNLTSLTQETLNEPLSYSVTLNDWGCSFLYGKGMKKNEALAFKLFQKDAITSSSTGYGNVAYCYSHGKGIAQNPDAAKEALRSMLNLCETEEEKNDLLTEFANLGVKEIEDFSNECPEARIKLAQAYLDGNHGLAKDAKKAAELFEKLDTENVPHPLPVYEGLVRCYSFYEEQADSKKVQNAFQQLIQFYETCQNREEKEECIKSLTRWYKQRVKELDEICDQNSAIALSIARELLAFRVEGIALDSSALALKLILKAVAANDPKGYAAMAHLYSHGLRNSEADVDIDPMKALENIKKINPKHAQEAKDCLQIAKFGLNSH